MSMADSTRGRDCQREKKVATDDDSDIEFPGSRSTNKLASSGTVIS